MLELKTRDSLLQALRQAAQHPLTADEVRQQRVSFIMSTLKEGSSVTRARVEQILDAQEGRKTG